MEAANSTSITRVCATRFMDDFKHHRLYSEFNIGCILMYFDTENLCRFSEKKVDYIAFRPLKLTAVSNDKQTRVDITRYYKEKYDTLFFVYSPNQCRRLFLTSRINGFLIETQQLTYKCKHYYNTRTFNPSISQPTLTKQLEELAIKIKADEEPLKRERLIKFMEVHPETVRTQRHHYIEELIERVARELSIGGLKKPVVQRWIYEFRNNGGVQLTYMDKYRSKNNERTNRVYESEAKPYKFGNYDKTKRAS